MSLAVIIGNLPARITYAVLMALPFIGLVFFVLLFENSGYVYFTAFIAIPAILIGLTGKQPSELIIALQLTTLTALLFAVSLALTIAF